MYIQGCRTLCLTAYRVPGATAQEIALPTLTLPQAHLPCPGHLCPSNCSPGQAGSPVTIATAAHELLGERRRAKEEHLVTGSQHRSSATCLT